jgi:lysophospholipase L1-like esterase
MFEYARSVDMLIEHDYFHPSGEGQVQMAKLTHDFIKKKYNIDG